MLRLISYDITFEPLTEGSPPETPELATRYEELHPGQHEPEQWPLLLPELESLHNKYPDDEKSLIIWRHFTTSSAEMRIRIGFPKIFTADTRIISLRSLG